MNNLIQIQGKKIWYNFISPKRRDGKKPLIIFLHEGLGCSEQWKDFPELICNNFNVSGLVYDRYGYGKSQEIGENRTTDFLQQEAFVFLPDLILKLNITEPLIFFGHSDGGTIALLYASKFSEKISGLITEADHVFIEPLSAKGIRSAVASYDKGKLKSSLEKYHEGKTESMFRSWSGTWLSEDGLKWNIESLLPGINAPVLAIQGKNDNYGSELQLISKLKNISGRVEILYLPNCGHHPHHQERERVLQKTIDFI